jgi:hypothetical protein
MQKLCETLPQSLDMRYRKRCTLNVVPLNAARQFRRMVLNFLEQISSTRARALDEVTLPIPKHSTAPCRIA